MGYLALEFEAASDAAEQWADALLDTGALAVDLSDALAGTPAEEPVYGEPGERHELWTRSRLVALFSADSDLGEALESARAALQRAELPRWTSHHVDEQDWVRLTQAQFGPIRISARLWIIPSWCRSVDESAINITLDPGLAFGTGSHPTTRLCLEWLNECVRAGSSVLDYGCGSGLLAIAAAMLGAGRVDGVDIDSQAVAAAITNARQNGVAARFFLPQGLGDGTYDHVIANILTNPLCALAPLLVSRVKPGGTLLLSGVLETQIEQVQYAYAPWIALQCWRQSEGWVALLGKKSLS